MLQQTYSAEAARGALPADAEIVVCVPVFEAYTELVQCLRALVLHTPAAYPILLLDDGSRDERIRSLEFDGAHPVVVLHNAENRGFVHTANEAFALVPRADVVIVNSDVIVGPEWLERLRDAAYSAPNVATATPLTNHGTIVTLPRRNEPSRRLPDGVFPEQAARRVAERSPRLRPHLPTAIGHCIYVRRSALGVVGGFDLAFSPGYSEEVDFSQRAMHRGFVHVCADDVFVYHKGGASFGRSERVTQLQEDHDKLITERYPYYFKWVEEVASDDASPLATSLLVTSAAMTGIKVIVDGFCLGPRRMGTQSVVIESVRALQRHPEIDQVTVFAPKTIPSDSLALLSESGAQVVLCRGPEDAFHDLPDAHIVFRPYQVNRLVELEWLLACAPRVVVAQLDCIAFNNPSYFESYDRWHNYRIVNRFTSEFAHGMAFLSVAGLEQARASGLLRPGSPHAVTHLGVDFAKADSTAPPAGFNEPTKEFLLCFGASYHHKNRLAALRIYDELRNAGWDGKLVLAGPTPPSGNSLSDEDEYLLANSRLMEDVIRVESVTEAEKEWLYEHSALVLYPTLAEGFGIIPFEASARNVPCLSTRAGSLDEVLPADLPTIDPSDPAGAARLVLEVLSDGKLAAQICEKLNERAQAFTWDGTTEKLIRLFWQVLAEQGTDRSSLPDFKHLRGMRSAGEVASRSFLAVYRPLAWCIRGVVHRPRLRAAVAPDGSIRSRMGNAVVRYLDRRVR